MRTCAQAGSIRAMPETEIPRATRVDIYLFKRAEPVCRFPLRLSVFNPSIGFQSVYRFPIRPSAPYSSIGFQSVYRLPIRPSAPCSSIGFSPFRGLFFKHGENPRHRFLKFLVRRIVKDQQIVLFLGRVKLGGHLEITARDILVPIGQLPGIAVGIAGDHSLAADLFRGIHPNNHQLCALRFQRALQAFDVRFVSDLSS